MLSPHSGKVFQVVYCIRIISGKHPVGNSQSYRRDHSDSPPYGAKIQNRWSYISILPHTFIAQCLVCTATTLPYIVCIFLSSFLHVYYFRLSFLSDFLASLIMFLSTVYQVSLFSLILDAFFRPIISCRSFIYFLPLLFLSNNFSNSCLYYVFVHISSLIIFYIYCPSLFFSATFCIRSCLFILSNFFFIKLVPSNYHS